MRRFTKNHNDINWLFPKVTDYQSDSEKIFDQFEKFGKNLLNLGYKDQKIFTCDDMIDAFMKGASVMNQIIREDISFSKSISEEIARINRI